MRPLVREAENRLASADVVVFIGYRFPESDALARAMITEALANNTARLLRVVIVLGNNSPDVTRVERLVSFAIDRTNRIPLSEEKRPFTPSSRSRRYYDLRIEPLLGEEYIHGFDRRAIWHQAWRPPMP